MEGFCALIGVQKPFHTFETGSLEVFLDEDVDYALRLAHAGVPVELHVYPCTFHGFDGLAATSAISQRFHEDRDQALKRALHP